MEELNRVLQMREGGNVARSHCIPHLDQYSVGKHTFDMLVLLDVLHPSPSLQLYQAILRHDLHERWTGDPPGSIKNFAPGVKEALKEMVSTVEDRMGLPSIEITAEEEEWIKALDQVEFYMWTLDQAAMGNKNAETSCRYVLQSIDNMDLPEEVQVFMEHLITTGWYRSSELR